MEIHKHCFVQTQKKISAGEKGEEGPFFIIIKFLPTLRRNPDFLISFFFLPPAWLMLLVSQSCQTDGVSPRSMKKKPHDSYIDHAFLPAFLQQRY